MKKLAFLFPIQDLDNTALVLEIEKGPDGDTFHLCINFDHLNIVVPVLSFPTGDLASNQNKMAEKIW